jgi:hypothetical protein
MDALIKSIQELFGSQHRYLVPAYQRRYVWTEGRQWEPLWEDVERVADARLEEREQHHFLGAIVIRREKTPPGGITEWSIIDGQQRLTTLQLMVSAMADAAREDGHAAEARKLEKLIHHDEDEAEGDARFKFWPTTANRDAFRSVMREGGPGDDLEDDPSNTVHEAWSFFRGRAHDYAHADAADPENVALGYSALREAVTGLLQLVTISLDKNDPAQVIFETLNARGTPLLAMDLVKNALFDAADKQGAAVDQVHDEFWKDELGDHDYWGADQRLGRVTVPRSEGFLMHWLAMQLGEVVPADRLFELFRRRVLNLEDGVDAIDVIRTLNSDAKVLRSFDGFAPGTLEHRFFNALAKLDTTTMHPVSLLLFRSELEAERRARALQAIESYLVRRMLRGLSGKNYSQLAARLIARARTDLSRADELIVDELLDSQADTYRWPTDDELREHLESHPLYGWLGQARIVMVLSAVELADRRGKTEAIQTLPPKLEVEHLMPRSWREHWPLPDSNDPEVARTRNSRIDLLGNLTLVPKPLNASMSNSAWTTKRNALDGHSLLLLNRVLAKLDDWDEAAISKRGSELVDRIVRLWCGPQSFMPEDWRPREAESWPEFADIPLDDVGAIFTGASPHLRALLTELGKLPGERRRFADIEATLDWPGGRLRSVCGGYSTKTKQQYGGMRPWHIHLDEDGAWWIWMDAERAGALTGQSTATT